jgi:hypothetical protein
MNNEIFGKKVIFREEDGTKLLHTFDLIGTNKRERKVLLNDIQIDNLYVDKFFKKFYLFNNKMIYRVGPAKYYNKLKEDKIFNEYKINHGLDLIHNKITIRNADLNDDKKMEDPHYRFFKELELKIYPPDTNSRSGSPITGGANKSAKAKYIKTLRNKTLEKLQIMAKNKKVKYTKKVDGKSVAIKKETLIKKLCKHKYDKIKL